MSANGTKRTSGRTCYSAAIVVKADIEQAALSKLAAQFAPLVPAKAGTQFFSNNWIPACAG
jgi:hypothetical protein